MRFVVILDDTKLSGEATSMPHARYPPYRVARIKKMLTAIMKTRADPPVDIDDGDLFVIHDGLRPGTGGTH